MKKILVLISFIFSLTLVSCSDFLDNEVRGSENLDTYFQSSDDAENFITGCYQSISFGDWWQVGKFWGMVDMCTDDCWMGNTTQSSTDYYSIAHYKGEGSSNAAVANFWQYRYKGILRCNIAVERISEVESTDTELIERLVAEAKFLRGFMYFDLVKNFGGVPLVTGFDMPEDIIGITRATQEEVYAFIEQDFLDAIAVLPERSEYADADMGRATKGAAQSFLGKVYLYQEKWTEAVDVLYDVISNGEYELLSDFGNVWSMHYNNSKEGIFEIQYMFDETYALGGYFSIIQGNRDDSGWAWCLPTSDLENAFIAAGDTERLKYTIIKHGDTEIAGEDNFEDLLASLSSSTTETYPGVYPITPSNHKSARVGRKFFIPYADRPTGYFTQNRIPLNHRLMRYADVLLMYAEAQYEAGNESAALTKLNEVRTRAKLSSLTVSGTVLRDAIRLERRLELALEQNRLYDIRRWEESNGKKTIENLMGPTGTFVTYNLSDDACPYEADNQVESSDKGTSFDVSRDLLFPIPLYEITSSGGTITQNPGWE